MKPQTTFILFLLVCMIGAGIWLVERDRKIHATRYSLRDRVLQINSEDVRYVRFEQGDDTIECQRQEDDWLILSPVQARGAGGELERILSGLEALAPEDIITERQMETRGLTLADYGLDAPRARLIVRDHVRERELLIGNTAPLGDLLYARLAELPEVLSLRADILSLFPPDAGTIRARGLMRGKLLQPTRIDLHRPEAGFVRLVRDANRWEMQQPVKCAADANAVQQLLDRLSSAEISDFIWDAPSTARTNAPGEELDIQAELASFTASYGLAPDEAAARVEIWEENELLSQELIIGKPLPDGSVYAKRRDVPSIYAVSSNVLSWLQTDADSLRGRSVFGFDPDKVRHVSFHDDTRRLVMTRDENNKWKLTEPVKQQADTDAVNQLLAHLSIWEVSRFLDEPTAITTASNAFLNPVCTIHISDKPVARDEPSGENSDESRNGPATGVTAVVGAISETDSEVFLQYSRSEGYGVMPRELYELLPTDPLQALPYKDRLILNIPRENVRSITLTRNGQSHAVTRQASGVWIDGIASNKVDTAVVDTILKSMESVRALRLEAELAPSLEPYGLQTASTMLTLGLSGEVGIQKKILFGFRSRTDGVFAAIHGQDLVFVLPSALVETITRDLTLTE